jgi:putative membrane protein
MKPYCIVLLALVATACRTDRDRADENIPKSMSAEAGDGGYRSQPDYEARRNIERKDRTAASMGEPTTKALSADDRKFVTQAAQGGMFEVRSSRLALEKNTSAPTRDFAQMMLDDHGKANRDLERLVSKKGGTLADELDAEHQARIDELSRLEGREFERKYHDAQVKAHDQAIRLFERCSRECDDQDLRAFANRLLPKLRDHRKHLDDHPMN